MILQQGFEVNAIDDAIQYLYIAHGDRHEMLLINADTARQFTLECGEVIDPLHPSTLSDMTETIVSEYLSTSVNLNTGPGVVSSAKKPELNEIWELAAMGLGSLNKIAWMLRAIKENRPIDEIIAELRPDRQDFTFNETQYRQIVETSMKRQDMPASTTLLQLEYFMRGLFNQWGEGLSTEVAESSLEGFLKHISAKDGADVYGEGTRLYTEPMQVENVLTQTLTNNQDSSIRTTLVVGVGDGTGPDVRSLNNIGIGGFDAIDINTQPTLPEEARFIQTDLQSFSPDGHYEAILNTGSGLLNQESLATQLSYWRKIAELLEQNGKYYYEVGALDPDQAKNYLFAAAQSFNEVHPSAMFGARNRRSEYRQSGETDETFGAHIFPDFVTKLLAKLAGLECRNVQFYQTKPDAYRALYTFRKTGEPNPLLNLILSVCSRAPVANQ